LLKVIRIISLFFIVFPAWGRYGDDFFAASTKRQQEDGLLPVEAPRAVVADPMVRGYGNYASVPSANVMPQTPQVIPPSQPITQPATPVILPENNLPQVAPNLQMQAPLNDIDQNKLADNWNKFRSKFKSGSDISKDITNLFSSKSRMMYICSSNLPLSSKRNSANVLEAFVLPFGIGLLDMYYRFQIATNAIILLVLAWYYVHGKLKDDVDWTKIYLITYFFIGNVVLGQIGKIFLQYDKTRVSLYALEGNPNGYLVSPCLKKSAGATPIMESDFYAKYRIIYKGGTLTGL
jgi:hypothetical protein